jgi:GDP-mannose 6-dehydrogenase
MRISVFGMGYVGSVTAACLAHQGHIVVGVDVNPEKVDSINAGRTPVIEPKLADIIRESVEHQALRATTEAGTAVRETDLSLICVGTPSTKSGRLDLGGVEQVSREVGRALRHKSGRHDLAIRTTVLPGTSETLVTPLLESESGKKSGKDFGVCYNPEFMREGTAVADFFEPPFTVIGANGSGEADVLESLYAPLNKPIMRTQIRLAEMLKYVCNAFHAVKISFANEVGTLARASGIDSHALMELFCSDHKLNISRAYLQPGFAFGGSCLPKDIRAMLYRAKELDFRLPVLEAILPSNQLHVDRGVDLVLGTGRKKIGVLGLSFKPDTDDLRESPMVTLVKALVGEGCQVRIFDEKVKLSALIGANRRFIEESIPHIGALLDSSLERVVRASEVVVLGRDAAEFTGLSSMLSPSHTVVRLSHSSDLDGVSAHFVALC